PEVPGEVARPHGVQLAQPAPGPVVVVQDEGTGARGRWGAAASFLVLGAGPGVLAALLGHSAARTIVLGEGVLGGARGVGRRGVVLGALGEGHAGTHQGRGKTRRQEGAKRPAPRAGAVPQRRRR